MISVENPSGYARIPEGTYALKVVEAKPVPRDKPTSLAVTFVDKDGIQFKNNYDLTRGGGYGACKYLLAAFGLDIKGCDEQEMVGGYVLVEVVHNHVVGKKDGADLIYPNIKQCIKQVDGFDGEAEDEIDDDEPF